MLFPLKKKKNIQSIAEELENEDPIQQTDNWIKKKVAEIRKAKVSSEHNNAAPTVLARPDTQHKKVLSPASKIDRVTRASVSSKVIKFDGPCTKVPTKVEPQHVDYAKLQGDYARVRDSPLYNKEALEAEWERELTPDVQQYCGSLLHKLQQVNVPQGSFIVFMFYILQLHYKSNLSPETANQIKDMIWTPFIEDSITQDDLKGKKPDKTEMLCETQVRPAAADVVPFTKETASFVKTGEIIKKQ